MYIANITYQGGGRSMWDYDSNGILTLFFILFVLLTIVITLFVTKDARKRGFREIQVLFLALASVFTFPIGLILYLFLRPSERVKS